MNNYGVITDFLKEVGADAGNSYSQAVASLKNYLKIKNDKKAFVVNFGDYGIVAEDYCLISAKQIEAVRKSLKKLKKVKIFVRLFPTVKLSGKEFYSLAEPDMVLWELSGIDLESVKKVADGLSASYGFSFKVICK